MADYVIRATAAQGQIRAFAATTRDLVEQARISHNTSPVATAALGRLLTAGVMMGCDMKGENDLLTLKIQGDGPIAGLTVTADSRGNVKGYAFNPMVMLPPNEKGKLDVGGALGVGVLSVIKDIGLKEPYVGQTILVTGEIAEDLTYYYATSEQTPSSVALGVLMNKDNTVRQSGGFIIQLMPGASEDIIGRLENKLKEISSITTLLDVGNTPEMILEYVLGEFGLEIGGRLPAAFYCNCTKDRVASGNIYFGHRGKKIIVLSPAGDIVKEIALDVEVLSGMSLSKDGTVYFGSSKNTGYFGYDFATGTQKFVYQKDLGGTALKGNSYTIGADGTIYTIAELTSGGAIIALNPDGTEKWVYKTPGAIVNGGVVIGTDGTLYANGGNAVAGEASAGVFALNSDGSLKWHYATTEDVNNCVPIIDNRGYIHIISNKAVYYIVKQDGSLLASAELGVKCTSSPVMDSRGYLYVGIEAVAGASDMVCISSGATSYANSGWPMKGQNPQRTGLQK